MAESKQHMAKSKINKNEIIAFKKIVRDFAKKHGRSHLPWRKTSNPYRILVSEIMLQQTQVDRVIPFYKNFLKKFPTVKKLSEAPLSEVLKVWQGLGYNRRAKMLHEAAKKIMIYHNNRLPSNYDELIALPGVGDYTAKAVLTFAFNKPVSMIETNIRSVFIHHFFSNKREVDDKDIFPLIEQTLPKQNPSAWYAALMDYGSFLKKINPNPSRKSRHHTKQKPFKGSDREIRGAIIKALVSGPKTISELQKLPFEKGKIKKQVDQLKKEKMAIKKKQLLSVPDFE